MEIQLTESREFIRIANELPVIDLGLIREMFFPVANDRAVMADKIDILVRSASNNVATLQHKNGRAKVVNKQGKNVIIVEPPTIREKTPATAEYLLTFDPSKVWGKTAEEISAMRGDALADIVAELKARAENRIGIMASELVQTGKITYTDTDGFSFELDMDWPSELLPNLTGTARWSQSTNDIDGNLTTWAGIIRKKSASPNAVIMGENAFNYFKKDDKIKGNFDRQNWRVGALTPNLQTAYQGTYNGLDIFVPSGTYVDIDGVEKSIYDKDKITLFNKEQAMRDNAVLYGLIREVASTVGEKIFAKQWVDEDPSVIWNLIHLAPVPSMPVVGSVLTAKVHNVA